MDMLILLLIIVVALVFAVFARLIKKFAKWLKTPVVYKIYVGKREHTRK